MNAHTNQTTTSTHAMKNPRLLARFKLKAIGLIALLVGLCNALAQGPYISVTVSLNGAEAYFDVYGFPTIRTDGRDFIDADVSPEAQNMSPLNFSDSVFDGSYLLSVDLRAGKLGMSVRAPSFAYAGTMLGNNWYEAGRAGSAAAALVFYDKITVYGPFGANTRVPFVIRSHLLGTMQGGSAAQGWQGRTGRDNQDPHYYPLVPAHAYLNFYAEDGSGTGYYLHTSPATGEPAGGPLEAIDQTIEYYVDYGLTIVAGQSQPVPYSAQIAVNEENGAFADLTASFEIILPRGYSYTSQVGLQMPVTYVNAAPSFIDAGNVTVPGNSGPQAVANWATEISAGPSDEAGQTLSFLVTGNSNPGLFAAGPAVEPNGTLTCTPAPNATGSAQVTVVLHDSGGTTLGGVDTSAPHTFTITVSPVNTAPVANAQAVTTAANTPVAITLTGSDADGNPLSYWVLTGPAHGLLSGTAPNLTYTPAADYSGADSFTFKVNDGVADSAPATVSIAVTPANVPPLAVDDSYTTDEKTVLNVGSPGVLGNDSDPDAGPLVKFRFRGHMLSADADFTAGEMFTGFYSLNPAAVGVDHPDWTLTFQYVTYDAAWELAFADTGYKFSGNVSVISAGNDTAFGDRYIATLSTSASVGTPLPSGRQMALAQFDLQEPISVGTDLLQDDSIQSTTINLASAQIAGGRFLFIGGTQPQLKVDQLDGPMSVSAVNGQAANVNSTITLASGATLRVNGNGSFSYDPNGRFAHLGSGATATETFTYEMSDREGATASATVTITIVGVNDAPVANAQSASTAEDVPLAITLTGSDPDGDALSYTVLTSPVHGTLSGTAPSLTYTPAANYSGPDSFTFKVNDGTVDSASATVALTVTPVNDPPVAVADYFTILEDTSMRVDDVLTNDTDADGDALTVAEVRVPSHGNFGDLGGNVFGYFPTLNYSGQDGFRYIVSDGHGGTATNTAYITVSPVNDAPAAASQAANLAEDAAAIITLNGSDVDGDALSFSIVASPVHGILSGTAPNLTYTPAPNFNGPDSFAFKVNDGTLNSAVATVSLIVTPVNDAPAAGNDMLTVAEDAVTFVPLASLLANDMDVDGDVIRLGGYVPNTTQGGRMIHNEATQGFTYTPAPNFFGQDTFQYDIFDGQHYPYSSGVVTITVTPVNDVPLAASQLMNTDEDVPLPIMLAGSDEEGTPLAFSIVTQPAHGALTGSAPNLTYTPTPDYHGPDSFTFRVSDGQATSAAATVNITVMDVLMGLSAISPTSATANETGFTLAASGSHFESDTVVYWNGSARPTTYVSPTQVTAQIPASDLADVTDIQTVNVTVGEPAGPESAAAIFAIVPASVGEVQASVVPAGEAGTVSSPPTSSTEPGVTLAIQNNGGGSVTAVAATYDTKPTGQTVFKVDSGSFVDVQFTGADSSDVALVNFYYPASITGGKENSVKLRYFDGANWIEVLSSGGVVPTKDTTDNLDSTVSGGRFTVTFDNTSTPKITDLHGTIFGMIDPTPQILSVAGPTGPLALGSSASVNVTFALPDPALASQITFTWDDGSTTVVTGNNGTASATHQYAAAGVYGVTVTVSGADGTQSSATFEYVVIYDPSAGFVTGGGWIDSPLGAYAADPSLTGKATFGFVSKYQKGANVPTGNTEFQFKASDLNFSSTAYQWLVVAGAKAQYKGDGTINGTGSYGFLLTATDGQINGGDGVDKFRIKIWDKATGLLVYDNMMGASEDINSANPQIIGGGSIVIHKAN